MVKVGSRGICPDIADAENTVQEPVLRHIIQAGVKHFAGAKAGNVPSVQPDLPALHLVAAENCGSQLCSPGADNARQAEYLTGIDLQADILKAIAAQVFQDKDRLRVLIIDCLAPALL